MKITLKITLLLAILAFAAIACAVIFNLLGYDEGKTFLWKAEAVIFLVGGCAAVISLLMGKDSSAD